MGSVDFSWLIGGPQGSGVESGANIFSKVCAELGYQIFGKREFYSNIKGEHSYFIVRVSDEKIRSNVNDVSLMISFDAETIFRHFDEVSENGAIIYDSDLEDADTDKVRTLDTPFKERLHNFLESKDKPFTISGVLELAKDKGVRLFPVSFKSLLESLSEEVDNPKLRGLVRMYNVIGVSLSLGLIKMPSDSLLRSIDSIFAKKPQIARLNKHGMMIGAALTGTRSSTSTSGPGFALMTEALGWAGINEVPVVITLYQRSGPSTGLPTRHGQDDLLFTVFAGHGDFPKLVYASGDIEESFYDTGRCFNYADIYQIPVIHMMDKFLSSSVVTCKKFDPEKITINRGKLVDRVDGKYKRFAFTDDGISPRSRLGLDNGIFWNTGDESDEYGHITEDPQIRIKMMDKRMSRLDLALEQIPNDEQVASFGVHEFTIISWGSTKGPILDALSMIKRDGIDVGFLQIKLLHPFPGQYVKSLLSEARTIIDVEANHSGQLGKIFQQNISRDVDYYILKYTGRAMTSTEIYDSLRKIVENRAEKREVLSHGA